VPGDRGAAWAAGVDGAGVAAPAGSPAADAVAAVAAAAATAVMVAGVGVVARWELASAVTCGLLLAPSWPSWRATRAGVWAAAS
jgi:hypothetical protein